MTQLEPERFQFTSADGLSIACVKWRGPHHVRGVIQIAHGLGEHLGRHAELAETLARESSSDRAIGEYAAHIWKVGSCPVP
jgi:alpha-beta hydrolase superfamily lysophospholipase